MEVDEAYSVLTRVSLSEDGATAKRLKVHNLVEPLKRVILQENSVSNKRSRTAEYLKEHINDCVSVDELDALYQSCEDIKSAFEHLFFDRKQVLQYQENAKLAMSSQLWLEAKQLCTTCLNAYGFDCRTVALLCECLINLKSSQEVVEYFHKLKQQLSTREERVLYPLLCQALLRTGKHLDVLLKIGNDHAIKAKANKLQTILQSSVITTDLVKQGLEISPECVELQQRFDLLHSFPTSSEFRSLQPITAKDFGLLLFDRMDFCQAAIFIPVSLEERELITKLQRVKANPPNGPELVEFETRHLHPAVFAARPHFHSNWLMWRATLATNRAAAVDLLRSAVRADPTNEQARVALEMALEKQRQAAAAAAAPLRPPAKQTVAAAAPPPTKQTLYEVLDVPQTCSLVDIRKAYKQLALRFHPDKNPDGNVQFDRISRAHEVLSNREQRQVYNITLYKI